MQKKALTVAGLAARALASAPSPAAHNVNVYWGQSGSTFLGEWCETGHFEYVTIAFINNSPENDPSNLGYPGTNFGAHCNSLVYTDDQGVDSLLLSGCNFIAEDIPKCQAAGKKVLISIGGHPSDTSKYGVSTAAKGVEFANFVWEAFGPYDPSSSAPRPFDYEVNGSPVHVAVDGFDFDLEVKYTGAEAEGYIAMVKKLRQLTSTEPDGKSRLITAAPQCPIANPDYFQLKDIIEADDVVFDAFFIQFYNNPVCDGIPGNAAGDGFNLDDWIDYIEGTDSKDAKLYIGLPGSPGAAGSGYLEPEAAEALITPYIGHPSFGGVMLWDISYASENIVEDGTYLKFIHDCVFGNTHTAPSSSAALPSSSAPSSAPSSGPSSVVPSVSASITPPPSSVSAAPSASASSSSAYDEDDYCYDDEDPTASSAVPSASVSSAAPSGSSSVPSGSISSSAPSSVPSGSASSSVPVSSAPSSSVPASISAAPSSVSSSAPVSSSVSTDDDYCYEDPTDSSAIPSSTPPASVSSAAPSGGVSSSVPSGSVSSSVPVSSVPSSVSVSISAPPSSISSAPSASASSTSDEICYSDEPTDVSSAIPSSSAPASVSSAAPSGGVSSSVPSGSASISAPPSSISSAAPSGSASSTSDEICYSDEPTGSSVVPSSSVPSVPPSSSVAPSSVPSSYSGTATSDVSASGSITSSVPLTTSTVFSTTTETITSCPPHVPNCHPGHVVTKTIAVSTTVCPVSEVETTSTSRGAWPTGWPTGYTTSTVYSTKTYTITSCGPTVTNCHPGHVTTEVIPVSTTVCPITDVIPVPTGTGKPIIVPTWQPGPGGPGAGGEWTTRVQVTNTQFTTLTLPKGDEWPATKPAGGAPGGGPAQGTWPAGAAAPSGGAQPTGGAVVKPGGSLPVTAGASRSSMGMGLAGLMGVLFFAL